jgi:hypothetical protein
MPDDAATITVEAGGTDDADNASAVVAAVEAVRAGAEAEHAAEEAAEATEAGVAATEAAEAATEVAAVAAVAATEAVATDAQVLARIDAIEAKLDRTNELLATLIAVEDEEPAEAAIEVREVPPEPDGEQPQPRHAGRRYARGF